MVDWQSPLDSNNRLNRQVMEQMYNTTAWLLYWRTAKELSSGGENNMVINKKLFEISLAIIKTRPTLYITWVLKAFRSGIIEALARNYMFVTLFLLLVMTHVVYVIQHVKANFLKPELKLIKRQDYFLEFNMIMFVASSFAFSKILLTVLVEQPLIRYVSPASIFFPAFLVVALFERWQRLSALRHGHGRVN